MIIRTAIQKADCGRFKNAEFIHDDGKLLFFRCSCGRPFHLRATNTFISFDALMCPACKKRNRLLPNIGERWIYNRIQKDAREGGRDFSLTFEQVAHMIHLPCHYCGRQDCNKIDIPSKSRDRIPLLQNFRYNGIDRVDNTKGYTIQNTVPCCMVCNRAKNSMSYREFIEYLDALTSHRSSGKVNHDNGTVPLPDRERLGEGWRHDYFEGRESGAVVLRDTQYFNLPFPSTGVRWTVEFYSPGGESEGSIQEEESEAQG